MIICCTELSVAQGHSDQAGMNYKPQFLSPVHTVAPSAPVFNYLCIISQLPSTISLRQTQHLIEGGSCFTAGYSQAVLSVISTASELKKLWSQSSITTSKQTSTRSQSICGDYPHLPRADVCFLVDVKPLGNLFQHHSNCHQPLRTKQGHPTTPGEKESGGKFAPEAPRECHTPTLSPWHPDVPAPARGRGASVVLLLLLLLIVGLLHQVALTADHPQLVLVGGGQVDGSWGDCRPEVPWVGDLQVGSSRSSGENCRQKSLQWQHSTFSWQVHIFLQNRLFKGMKREQLTLEKLVPESRSLQGNWSGSRTDRAPCRLEEQCKGRKKHKIHSLLKLLKHNSKHKRGWQPCGKTKAYISCNDTDTISKGGDANLKNCCFENCVSRTLLTKVSWKRH